MCGYNGLCMNLKAIRVTQDNLSQSDRLQSTIEYNIISDLINHSQFNQ